MKAGNEYRGSRRNEARSLRLPWRGLDRVAMATGELRVKYPFEKNGKPLSEEAAGA